MATCNDPKNLGGSPCGDLPQYPRAMIEVPKDFEFTAEEMADVTFWQDAVLADEGVFIWPLFFNVTNQSDASSIQSTPLGEKLVNKNRYKFQLDFDASMCVQRAIESHSGPGKRFILVDVENQWLVTKKANGKFTGMLNSNLISDKVQFSDGASNASLLRVLLSFANANEVGKEGYTFNIDFFDEIIPLADVEVVTVDAPTITTIHLSVLELCGGTPVSGLVAADFYVHNAGGGTIAITSVAETTPGHYTLTGTAFLTGGTAGIKAPDVLTVKAYQMVAPALLTF